MAKFFTVQRRGAYCSEICNKPATHKVMGTGNILYGYFCEVHADKKMRSLERYYKAHEKEN